MTEDNDTASTEREIDALYAAGDLGVKLGCGCREWQPIDTAPKDGTWFLSYRGPSEIGRWDRILVARWDDDCEDFIWPDDIYDIYGDEPLDVGDMFESGGTLTHWMPLPEPPEATP